MQAKILITITLLIICQLGVCQERRVWENENNDYEVIDQYYLEDQEFTEGYFYDAENERILESTGLYRQSIIRSYVLNDDTGDVEDITVLYTNPDDQFGEGLSQIGDTFYQLTYQNGVINIFHEENIGEEGDILVLDRTAAIPRDRQCQVPEGWGMTTDGHFLYMTDGSNRIFRIDPDNLQDFDQEIFETEYTETGCDENSHFDHIYFVSSPETGEPLRNLNELELVGNFFYVNIWDPAGGAAQIARLRMEGESIITTRLYDFWALREITWDVLLEANVDNSCETLNEFNGIAYDENENEFILTGKNWPIVFRVAINDNPVI